MKLMAVIGDEETCLGYRLAGIGEVRKDVESNLFVVDENTAVSDIEAAYKKFIGRADIDFVLITQNVAEKIRHLIDSTPNASDKVIEIPSDD